MGLIEGWRKIAQLNLSATSVLDNNNARGFGMALASAAADLESACTPRPPKVEWFQKWDSWMVLTDDDDWFIVRQVEMVSDEDAGGHRIEHGDMSFLWFSEIRECIPVESDGVPSFVGWDVVGG